MENIFLLCIAFISCSAVFAQKQDDRHNNGYNSATTKRQENDLNKQGFPYSHIYRKDDQHRDNGYSTAPAERIQHVYDQRGSRYDRERPNNSDESNHRRQEPERGWQQNSPTGGKGIVVAAIAGLVLGALLSH